MLRHTVLLSAFVALAMSACGKDAAVDTDRPSDTTAAPGTAPDTTTPATVPAEGVDPVVVLSVQGMFPVQAPFLQEGPQAIVYADGTYLVPSRADPVVAPQVWPYRIGHLDPSVVADLLDAAGAAGLLAEPPVYGRPIGMADPPRTTLVLRTADGTFTHVADGLTSTTDDPQRQALQAFTGRVASLEMGTETEWYQPATIAIVAAPARNPSTTVDWPDDDTDLAAATECTIVDDPTTVTLLQASVRGAGFVQDGVTYQLAARVTAPGIGC
jgi:hypothetical protein